MRCYEVVGLSSLSSAAAAVNTCLALTALVVAYVVFILASLRLAKVTVKISVVVVHFFSLEAVISSDGGVAELLPADISSSLAFEVLVSGKTEDISRNHIRDEHDALGIRSPSSNNLLSDHDFFQHANLERVGVPWGSIPTNIYIIQQNAADLHEFQDYFE